MSHVVVAAIEVLQLFLPRYVQLGYVVAVDVQVYQPGQVGGIEFRKVIVSAGECLQ